MKPINKIITIYISTDNEIVKNQLRLNLTNSHKLSLFSINSKTKTNLNTNSLTNSLTNLSFNSNISMISYNLNIMMLKTKIIFHGKHPSLIKLLTSNEGFYDLVFDWYCLSLCNEIISYRKNYAPSSFAITAQRLSGTYDLTDIHNGRGIGTKGLRFKRKYNNELYFEKS